MISYKVDYKLPCVFTKKRTANQVKLKSIADCTLAIHPINCIRDKVLLQMFMHLI